MDIRSFLAPVGGGAGPDPMRRMRYKSANTDVVAWICVRVSRRSLWEPLLEIVEMSGPEDTVFLSTDRQGTPFVGSGLRMALHDLARYGLLLARGGETPGRAGVRSKAVRDATRSERSKGSPSLLGRGHYRNFLETEGTWLGHNGYAGQWLMVYPESEIVIACLNGLADDGGLDRAFIRRLAAMGEQVAGLLTRA